MKTRKQIHSEPHQKPVQPVVEEWETDMPEEPEQAPPPQKGLKAFFSRIAKALVEEEPEQEPPSEQSEETEEVFPEIPEQEENFPDEPEEPEQPETEEIVSEVSAPEPEEEIFPEIAKTVEPEPEPIEEYTEYTELEDAPEEMPDFPENHADMPHLEMSDEGIVTIDGKPEPEEKPEDSFFDFMEDEIPSSPPAETEEDEDEEEDDEFNPDGTRKKNFFSVAIPVMIVLVVALGFAYCFQLGLFDEREAYYMPDLVGRNYYDLGEDYTKLDIQVEQSDYSAYDKDVIFAQNIPAGTEVKIGQPVKISLSLGYAMTTVPDVRNYQFDYAQKLLEQSGFKTKLEYEASLNGTTTNNVIRTLPASGDEIAMGSEITLYVSSGLGAEAAQVQDFTNMLLADAEDLCEMYGLEVEAVPIPALQAENVVVEQSIEAGSTVPFHTVITLGYSSGEQPSGTVPYQVNFPAYANGRFILDFINKDGNVIASSDVIVAGFSAGSAVPVEGVGSQEVTVVLNNYSTNLQAELGKYNFDFSTGTYTVIEEDMDGAFEKVGGIGN